MRAGGTTRSSSSVSFKGISMLIPMVAILALDLGIEYEVDIISREATVFEVLLSTKCHRMDSYFNGEIHQVKRCI